MEVRVYMMDAQPISNKAEKKRKQMLVSYNETDVDPRIDEWFANQKNKSKSVLFLVSQIIEAYGTNDILDIALTNARIFDKQSGSNVDAKGADS